MREIKRERELSLGEMTMVSGCCLFVGWLVFSAIDGERKFVVDLVRLVEEE